MIRTCFTDTDRQTDTAHRHARLCLLVGRYAPICPIFSSIRDVKHRARQRASVPKSSMFDSGICMQEIESHNTECAERAAATVLSTNSRHHAVMAQSWSRRERHRRSVPHLYAAWLREGQSSSSAWKGKCICVISVPGADHELMT
jgi:hypothetical protein